MKRSKTTRTRKGNARKKGADVLKMTLKVLPREDRAKVSAIRDILGRMVILDPLNAALAIRLTADELPACAQLSFVASLPSEEPFVPCPGDRVTILNSSVNYANGQEGVLIQPFGDGWAVKLTVRAPRGDAHTQLSEEPEDHTIYADRIGPVGKE